MERITVENFITDNYTNKIYISSLVDKVSGALDIETRSKLKSSIMNFSSNCELLYNTMDVWARDYMPIQLTKKIFLSFTYKPDYLEKYPECVTNWQLHNVHTQKQIAKGKSFDFQTIQMPIILDGGNVIKAIVNQTPCIIMCDKVLIENNVNEEDFRNWWKDWWKDNFSGTEMKLVLLPWEGVDYNPIGHADGIVRYIEEGKLLMTNYPDYDNAFGDYHGNLILTKLKEAGFEVKTLSYLNKFNIKENKTFKLLFKHSWCYINYLQVGNRVLVPYLGYDPLDKEALKQIDLAFNEEKHIVDVQQIDFDMTSIVEDLNNNQNSGGALNCLTWTIKG